MDNDADKNKPSTTYGVEQKKQIQIDIRFDDLVARIDATQRSEASIHKILSFLFQEFMDLK